MTESIPMPCTDWVQKLAARHCDDLSPSDRNALKEHLTSCQACARVSIAYNLMEAGIRSLPVIRPLPGLSYQQSHQQSLQQSLQRSHVKRVTAAPKLRSSLQLPIAISLAALSSLFIRISWSRFYQALHTLALIVLAHFQNKIVYVSSDSHYLYAMRSGSGFFLWTQKRYFRRELFSSLPIGRYGIYSYGSGVAYAMALDFCRYTARA